MSPARKAPKVYTYRWCGDYPAVISDRTSPEGNGITAVPGENFQTTEPLNHFLAEPQDDAAKAAAPDDGKQDEGEQTTEAGSDAPSEEGSA